MKRFRKPFIKSHISQNALDANDKLGFVSMKTTMRCASNVGNQYVSARLHSTAAVAGADTEQWTMAIDCIFYANAPSTQ